MLILANVDSFAIKYLVEASCLKIFIFQRRLALILPKHKGSGSSFQIAVLVKNFYEIFLL